MVQCKQDQILNPKTGRCVKKTGKIGQEILNKENKEKCNRQQVLNPKTGRCVKKTGKIGQEILGKKPKQKTVAKKKPQNIKLLGKKLDQNVSNYLFELCHNFGYKIGKKLGEGSYSTVYEIDYRPDPSIFMYPLLGDTRIVSTVLRLTKPESSMEEFKTMYSKFSSLGLAPELVTMGIVGKVEYSIMQRVSGTVDQLLSQKQSQRFLKMLIDKVIHILETLRKNNLTHHDLHWENIGFYKYNDSYQFTLIDFGMSRGDKYIPGLDAAQLIRTTSCNRMNSGYFKMPSETRIFLCKYLNNYYSNLKLQYPSLGPMKTESDFNKVFFG